MTSVTPKMGTEPKGGRADAATYWARNNRGTSRVGDALFAGLSVPIQALEALFLEQPNILVDSWATAETD